MYDIGDVAVLTARFTVANVLTDPTAVTVRVQAPDGTVTTPTATQRATGVYTANVPLTAAGTWRYQWTGTGAAAGVEYGSLYVRQEAF